MVNGVIIQLLRHSRRPGLWSDELGILSRDWLRDFGNCRPMPPTQRKGSGMRVKRFRVLLAAAAVPATAAALMLGTQAAQASTSGCTSGAYAGYCGTQVNNASLGVPALVFNAAGAKAVANNKVIGWTNSTSNAADDWFQLPYGGNPASGVMFVFAPRGVVSGMCAADPGNNKVVLRPCNGSNWQRWVATSTSYTGFYTWTNRGTHKILQSNGKGGQLTTVTPRGKFPGNQQWAFTR
jgi:hypothetical protein